VSPEVVMSAADGMMVRSGASRGCGLSPMLCAGNML
jgi:hypothetical protein